MALEETSTGKALLPSEEAESEAAMALDQPEGEDSDAPGIEPEADMENGTNHEGSGDATASSPISMVIPRSDYQDIEQLPPGALPQDSTAYSYIIRPNDYLTKIAFKEYGNPNEWRNIYRWNKVRIGDDPNLIYPYRDLDLYKPAAQIVEMPFDYIVHTVVSGENLWNIAGTEYKDERAWIVIFWDNEELLTLNDGLLKPGMDLRIRTRLW